MPELSSTIRSSARVPKRDFGDMFKTRKARPVVLPSEERYTSNEVARISGVSLRQLQWWDERKVVSPRQDGHKRVYMPEEVVEISVIAELRRKGFSLQKIRRVLKYLQKEMGKRLSDAIASDSEIHLLTDGKSIYSRRKRRPYHRSAEERAPADVPGLCHRSGTAVYGFAAAQAREVGDGRRCAQGKSA